MIRFFFRRPKFPVVCAAQDVLFAAKTPERLNDQICSTELPPGKQLPVIDATAEGWVLDTDVMVLSPLTFKKRWTKKEVIDLFNDSKTAKQAGLEYSIRSLSSKRFDRIIGDIVELILSANNPLQPTHKTTATR